MQREYVPPMPTPKIATRAPYDRIQALLDSPAITDEGTRSELRGWRSYLDGGQCRKLSPARLTRLAAIESNAVPGVAHGPRVVAKSARAMARATRAAEGLPEPARVLHPCLAGPPSPPMRPMVARPFVQALAFVLRLAA